MKRRWIRPLGPLGIALLAAFAATAQHHEHAAAAPPQKLGTVHFETSCDPAVQEEFDRGAALLHSFWFSAAIGSFERVLDRDPRCALAHWGVALSWWGNPFGGFRSAAALAAGRAAVEKARAAVPRTPRESAYVEAAAELYRDFERVDQRSRVVAYERAMERLAAQHPGDPEARIFYALALDQAALPTDRTHAKLLKAGALLEKELAAQPDHPGIAHYIIHSYDVPALAPRALEAARRYARIAPDAPHALHMPSHTFTRLGLWQDSIETNRASAAAARKDDAAAEELHALDYQVYAYLQLAQDAAARQVLDQLPAIGARIRITGAGNAAPPPAGFYALAAIPARYALERRSWREAAALALHETPFPWVNAVTHFARALGAARGGDLASAAQDVEKLASLAARLRAASESYWAGQVDIQHRVAAGWAAFAQGRRDEGITMLREAAALEDATEKATVMPGSLAPARELLGEMLLESGRAADALEEFERTMREEPNRFRTLADAAAAAEAAGEAAKARGYRARLVELGRNADAPLRPELEAARRE